MMTERLLDDPPLPARVALPLIVIVSMIGWGAIWAIFAAVTR